MKTAIKNLWDRSYARTPFLALTAAIVSVPVIAVLLAFLIACILWATNSVNNQPVDLIRAVLVIVQAILLVVAVISFFIAVLLTFGAACAKILDLFTSTVEWSRQRRYAERHGTAKDQPDRQSRDRTDGH